LTLEGATRLDVSALPLIYATQQQPARSNLQLTFEGVVPNEISTAMIDAGFVKLEFQQ
jgi:hypothetical protein